MPTRRDVAPRAGIGLLNLTCREERPILNDHDAHTVSPTVIRPDTRQDIIDGVDDIAVTVIADCPMRTLRGVAHDGHRRCR